MSWFLGDFLITRWVMIGLLIYAIAMQFFLSYHIGKWISHLIPKPDYRPNDKHSPSYNEESDDGIHPRTSTNVIQCAPNYNRTEKPCSEPTTHEKQFLIFLVHLLPFNLCIGAYHSVKRLSTKWKRYQIESHPLHAARNAILCEQI
jgi:hypothetical protein